MERNKILKSCQCKRKLHEGCFVYKGSDPFTISATGNPTRTIKDTNVIPGKLFNPNNDADFHYVYFITHRKIRR